MNEANVNDETLSDDNHSRENGANDVPLRDVTPFVAVKKAKSNVDARIDIGDACCTFTQVYHLSFSICYNLIKFIFEK